MRCFPLSEWCYGEASMLLYDHEHIIESRAGVQQGDPLGPLYFCCGIMAMVNDIQAMNPVTTNGTWMTAELLVMLICSRKCGICCRRVALRLDYTSTLLNASGRSWTLIAASPAPSDSMVCRRRIKLNWYHTHRFKCLAYLSEMMVLSQTLWRRNCWVVC